MKKKSSKKPVKHSPDVRLVGFYMPADLHKAFRVYCAGRDITASAALRGAVREMIGEGVNNASAN